MLEDENAKFESNSSSKEINGVTEGGAVVSVKESRAKTDTGPHELGHTLGLGHFNIGLLTSSSNSPQRSSDIYKGYIKGILKNVFKPKKSSKAKGHLNEVGEAPDKFHKGKVKENNDEDEN